MINKKMNKQGFTLIELLVSVSITAIVVFIATDFLIRGMDSMRYNQEFEEAVSAGRKSVEIISKEIRGANISDRGDYPIELASDQELIFYSDIDYDNDFDRVRYYLVDRTIYKGVTEATAAKNYPGPEAIEKIADYVNNGGQEIFKYYDSDGNETLDLDSIRMVNIRFLFNVNPGLAPDDIAVETDVQLRNLKSNL